MQVIQLKFITSVQDTKESITFIKEVKRALNIVNNIDEYALIVEASSSNGSKAAVTNITSGGGTEVSDFNGHVDGGELVTVIVSELLI